MTIPYNVTTLTRLEYIKEDFNKLKNPKYKKMKMIIITYTIWKLSLLLCLMN